MNPLAFIKVQALKIGMVPENAVESGEFDKGPPGRKNFPPSAPLLGSVRMFQPSAAQPRPALGAKDLQKCPDSAGSQHHIRVDQGNETTAGVAGAQITPDRKPQIMARFDQHNSRMQSGVMAQPIQGFAVVPVIDDNDFGNLRLAQQSFKAILQNRAGPVGDDNRGNGLSPASSQR